MDGKVDFFDISQILGYKYNTGQPASYTDGDLDFDGVVDFFDLATLLSANYNTGEQFGPAAQAAVDRARTPTLTGAVAPSRLSSSPAGDGGPHPTDTSGFSDGLDVALGLAADPGLRYQALDGGTLKSTDITLVPEPPPPGLQPSALPPRSWSGAGEGRARASAYPLSGVGYTEQGRVTYRDAPLIYSEVLLG